MSGICAVGSGISARMERRKRVYSAASFPHQEPGCTA